MTDQKDNKPWAWLHMTRRQYDTARLWKKSGMTRDEFGKKVLLLPQEVIELIKENVEAEILVDKIFKTNGGKTK